MEDNYYDSYWKERENKDYEAPYFVPMVQFLKKEIEPLAQKLDILEAGCGAAAFTPILKEYSSSIIATDVSKEQIKVNQERYPDIQFKYVDLSERLPFNENSFDLIWCSEVLEHLYFPLFALEEFNRILRPGGRLLATVPFHGIFKNVMIALFKFDHHYDPEYPHVRFFTENTLKNLLKKASFSKVLSTTCGMETPIRDWFIPTNLLVRAIK